MTGQFLLSVLVFVFSFVFSFFFITLFLGSMRQIELAVLTQQNPWYRVLIAPSGICILHSHKASYVHEMSIISLTDDATAPESRQANFGVRHILNYSLELNFSIL